MRTSAVTRRLWLGGVVGAGLAAFSAGAMAHHGWSWAVSEQSELKGTIQEISMAPPHPMLRVTDADGVLWQIDLGNPSQTQRSGFKADSAKPGDAVTVLGNKHKDPAKKQMKAVRITIAGTSYDMYPERIRTKS